MTGASTKMPEAPAGRSQRTDGLRRLVLAVLLTAIATFGAGGVVLRLMQDVQRTDAMLADIAENRVLAVQVATWLETASFDTGAPAGFWGEEMAAQAIARISRRHEAVAAAWFAGLGGGGGRPASKNMNAVFQRFDMSLRRFQRGVARVLQGGDASRQAARQELRGADGAALRINFDAIEDHLRAKRTASVVGITRSIAAGGAGAALGLALIIALHLRGPMRDIAALEAAAGAACARADAAERHLSTARRDRARALDLTVAGLELWTARVEAASALLARTPLSGTQMRMVERLRAALGDLTLRFEGMRVLAAFGDARLTVTPREACPERIYVDWRDEAIARVRASGREIICAPDLGRPAAVRADAMLIRRALDGLLEDALRRAPKPGAIHIEAEFDCDDRAWPELRVTLAHDGAPPSAPEIAAIGAPFSTRPPSASTISHASDLFALAVTAAICSATGGMLDFPPSESAGTRMRARLRMAPSAEAPPRTRGRARASRHCNQSGAAAASPAE